MAVRQLVGVDLTVRENELRGVVTPAAPAVQRIRYLSGER
jgi:hypothetical protein